MYAMATETKWLYIGNASSLTQGSGSIVRSNIKWIMYGGLSTDRGRAADPGSNPGRSTFACNLYVFLVLVRAMMNST